jgi:hypothetical protein
LSKDLAELKSSVLAKLITLYNILESIAIPEENILLLICSNDLTRGHFPAAVLLLSIMVIKGVFGRPEGRRNTATDIGV